MRADHHDATTATSLHCHSNSHAPPQCFWCMWKRQSGSRQSAPRPMRPLQQAGATALVRAHRCKLYAAVRCRAIQRCTFAGPVWMQPMRHHSEQPCRATRHSKPTCSLPPGAAGSWRASPGYRTAHCERQGGREASSAEGQRRERVSGTFPGDFDMCCCLLAGTRWQ